MGKFATGKQSLSISDRSGLAFPYTEMVREWTGAWVHISEYEPKQPQLDPRPHAADPQSLQHARSQHFQQPTMVNGVLSSSGGSGMILVDLTLPGDFAFSSSGMVPEDDNVANNRRQALTSLGNVTVSIT
jgi:hypothetical protein